MRSLKEHELFEFNLETSTLEKREKGNKNLSLYVQENLPLYSLYIRKVEGLFKRSFTCKNNQYSLLGSTFYDFESKLTYSVYPNREQL